MAKNIVNKERPLNGFEHASSKPLFNSEKSLVHRTSISRDNGRRIFDASLNKTLITFTNPEYTDQDLEWFEEAWSDSVAGTAIDKKVEFTIGKGVKPVFELIDDKGKDTAQIKKELEQFDDVLHALQTIDDNVKFNTRLADGFRMTKVFGRCIIAFDGMAENDIPTTLKLIHPRDTGRVFVDQDTWEIEKVRSNFPTNDFYPDEMIYMVNMPDSPKRRNKWFGVSEMERIVGAARGWRRIVEFDMPEAATAGWAKYGMFLVKKMGRTDADASTDMQSIADSLKPHAFNFVSVDAMDEIEYMPVDLEPKLKEMVELASFYERIIIGNTTVPTALLGREEDQNRATLLGKIRFFIEGPIEAERQMISETIGPQWYEKNIEKLGKKDILKTVRVKAEFEPIIIEGWDDQVEAVTQLKQILPNAPDDVLIELLNLEEKKDEIMQAPERNVSSNNDIEEEKTNDN